MKKLQKVLFDLLLTEEQREFISNACRYSLHTSQRRANEGRSITYNKEVEKNKPILESMEHLLTPVESGE